MVKDLAVVVVFVVVVICVAVAVAPHRRLACPNFWYSEQLAQPNGRYVGSPYVPSRMDLRAGR